MSSEPPETDPSLTEADRPSAEHDGDALAQAEAKCQAMKEQLLRTAADFDNYRKRSRREVEDALHSGRESMLRELLPVFDNLERATAHAEAVTDLASFVSGIEMVMRQFSESLKRAGIERVPGVGAPFDPALHEAIQQLESSELPPGSIAAEVQAGYRLGERLIRPAMVVVAKAPGAHAEARPSSGDGAGAGNGDALT